MIFNFNPKEYCFSSAIPDNFVMTGFQGDVVTIRIFLNRDVSPIFSTDIAAYKGRASIYDLRGVLLRGIWKRMGWRSLLVRLNFRRIAMIMLWASLRFSIATC